MGTWPDIWPWKLIFGRFWMCFRLGLPPTPWTLQWFETTHKDIWELWEYNMGGNHAEHEDRCFLWEVVIHRMTWIYLLSWILTSFLGNISRNESRMTSCNPKNILGLIRRSSFGDRPPERAGLFPKVSHPSLWISTPCPRRGWEITRHKSKGLWKHLILYMYMPSGNLT